MKRLLYDKEIDNKTLIQFIILYALDTADRLVAYGDLLNIVLENCNISFPDFQLSLDNLVKTHHAEALITGKNIQKFQITDKGRNLSDIIINKIPVYLREPIEKSIDDLLHEERIRNAVRGKISAVSPNEYTAECELYDNDNTRLMSISLYSGTREQAEQTVRYFKDNAEGIYARVIEAFSPDAKH